MSHSGTPLDFVLEQDFETILKSPILDIAARVWEPDRYEAFKTCYRSMRVIDDLVDDAKSEGRSFSDQQVRQLAESIDHWLCSLAEGKAHDRFQEQLLATMQQYRIPLWPWRHLADAMLFDLQHVGFETFGEFRRYCRGAAIAPAAVFMHLCGVREKSGVIAEPPFPVRRAASDLALFSYLVHIIRDIQKDLQARLSYFAADLTSRYHVTSDDWRQLAGSGIGSRNVARLVRHYGLMAAFYRIRALRTLRTLEPYLEPRYQLSLAIIEGLYSQIYERIQQVGDEFRVADLAIAPPQLRARLEQILGRYPLARSLA